MTKIQNLEATRGDDFEFTVVFTGSVVGCKIWFTIKNKYTDADADALLSINTSDNSGLFTSLGATEVEVKIPGAIMELALGNWYYDVQIKPPSGKIKTTQKGVFAMSYDVRRGTV